MRITFKKRPRSQGQMRLPESYSVNINGAKDVARIQRFGDSYFWFWYGDGINTASNPVSLEQCKANVMEHFILGASKPKV